MQLRDFGRHERVETTESNQLASRPPVELAEMPTLLERLGRQRRVGRAGNEITNDSSI